MLYEYSEGKYGFMTKKTEIETKRNIKMENEIEKIKVELPDPELVSLADKIVLVIEEGKLFMREIYGITE